MLPIGDIPLEVSLSGYVTIPDTVTILEDQTVTMDYQLQRDLGQGMNPIPNPFTPNGDGINDELTFLWPGAQGGGITVTIYTLEGVPVRTLAGRDPAWNGRDDAGEPVPGGIYVFMAWDNAGSTSGVVCVAR